MIPNLYKKKCQSCSKDVEVKQGFAYRHGNRWLTVCNSTACINRLGLKVPGTEDRSRKLLADGRIVMLFDREALPLLNAMPRAKFHPDGKFWTVSIKDQDLPRVIELADQLELEVAEELRTRRSEGTEDSREAKERASREGLYEFQREGVEFLALHKRALLSDDQGLGKTIQTIVALPKNPRVIAIVPASVKYNWKNEIAKWRPELSVSVLSGRNAFEFPQENEVIITNYDILPDWLQPDENKKVNIPEQIKKVLANVILICDEIQLAKKYKTKRAQKVNTLSKLCARVWFLTGTPLENRQFDLYGVLNAGGMVQEVFGSWNNFLKLFNGYKNKFGGYEFGDPDPQVPERLKRIMLRRLKKDVLKDLPPKTYQTIVVNEINKELKNELDKAWQKYEETAELPSFEEFSKIRATLARTRIPAMLEIVESYEESGEPLVVFSAHKDPINELGKRDGWAAITGDTPAKTRTDLVAKFQAGELKGIGITIKAGGVGITLTKASNELFIDLDWKPGANLQAEDRCHRIGATAENILIMQMVSNHPLDLHVHKLLNIKMRLMQKALDDHISFKAPKSREMPELIEETEEELKQRIEQAEIQAEEEIAKERIHAILGREQAKCEIPEPELTPVRKNMIREALDYMVARCDGAVERDGVGFNKPDAAIAHWIYRTGLHKDDMITYRVTERILSRYYRQLGGKFDSIWKPEI